MWWGFIVSLIWLHGIVDKQSEMCCRSYIAVTVRCPVLWSQISWQIKFSCFDSEQVTALWNVVSQSRCKIVLCSQYPCFLRTNIQLVSNLRFPGLVFAWWSRPSDLATIDFGVNLLTIISITVKQSSIATKWQFLSWLLTQIIIHIRLQVVNVSPVIANAKHVFCFWLLFYSYCLKIYQNKQRY